MSNLASYIKLFLRLAVSSSMLSAVADRFGIWPSEVCVWGNMDQFLAYTHQLMPYMPSAVVPFLGWTATVLEIALSVCLILGLRLRAASVLSGLLLLTFSVAMATSIGIKAPLDYSAFNAAAAALAIAILDSGPLELDQLISRRQHRIRL